MALSPAQRHSQRIAMEQKLKRSQALETTESMHLLIRALEKDVEHVRSLPTIADRVEYKRDVLLPRWVPTVEGTTTSAPANAWQKWNGKAWVDDAEAMRTALVSEADAEKKSLLKQANDAIATLQDAVDLDMATEEEALLLIAWKKYRVLLNRIQPEDAPEIVWPEVPGNVA
ncbi:tail fiber assembly protein [Escherichia coli]|uniref:tail fiber assembly protein n=1 Tax=Escherichia coli TaxID=562 RepID=UPI0002CB78DE|nr:tail fiber assembly protein [Escherichia coli]ENA56048.1 phage small terminase subunit [Escherichia coli 2726950]